MQKLNVFVFEDEAVLAILIEKVLLHAGHEVRVFPRPTSCPVFKDHGMQCSQNCRCADVIISDFQMPGMTGLDFFKLQRKRGCKLVDKNKALMSGSPLIKEMKHEIDDLGCHLIGKPFKMADLLTWVDECGQRLCDSQPH